MCVSKDSKFIKGYYRLSTAQIEMHMFDDAAVTVQAALQLEPGDWLRIEAIIHIIFIMRLMPMPFLLCRQ